MVEAQRNYVCCVMHDENILYKANINPDDLTDIPSRQVLSACKNLAFKGIKPDLSAVTTYLKDVVQIPDIMDIFDRGALHTNWEYYANALSKEIMTKKLIGLSPYVNDMIGARENPEEIISKASEYLDKIMIGFSEYRITGFDEIIPEIITDIENTIEDNKQNKGKLKGIDTGIPVLNELTGGWKERQLVYVGGRPSDGKSAALNGFIIAAANSGHNPGVISVESSLKEIVKRIISSDSRVPLSNIKSGMLTTSQISGVMNGSKKFYERNPHGYDEPNADLQTVITQARRLVSVYKCDCLFIDYIQQITPSIKTVPRNEQVADISKAMKSLARELNIPVIVAAQLRRPAQGHAGKRPSVDDFGESSQIEKDGDIEILIWHRDNPESGNKESFFLLEKQRDGATQDIPVYFNKEVVRFEERVV